MSDGRPGTTPLVSIVVPYYRRREVIQQSLDSLREQDYPNREIILVDNGSKDGIAEWVRTYAPEVKYIELPDNLGACAARNAGIRAAKGEILVFIDDDAGFISPLELGKVVKAFQDRPDFHVLAFRIYDPATGEMRLREWCHARYWKDFCETEFDTHWFCEGSSAFRRVVFERCGAYYEPLFYGPEGHDLSLRLLDRGFRILYTPQIHAWHRPSEKGRSLARQYYYLTRDFIWMAYKDYRFVDGLRYLAPKLAMMAYFTLRTGAYDPFFRGLWDGFTGLKRIRPDRTPISHSTVRYLAELESWRPSLWVRLAKHKAEPQV